MSPLIRTATADDAAAIAELLPHLGYEASDEQVRSRLAIILAHPDYATFVLDTGGIVVGLCLVSGVRRLASAGYAEVLELVVHADFQRQGLGKRLLSRAEAWAAEQGYARVRLRSGVHRTGAHEFYERVGYAKSRASYAFELSLDAGAGVGSRNERT